MENASVYRDSVSRSIDFGASGGIELPVSFSIVEKATDPLNSRKFPCRASTVHCFHQTLIFQTAQKLRRRTQQLASTLDIQQTLLASIKQGGWFTPIYGTKKVIPEYLFLIDRASYADHQAKLTEELIQQLQQNGVYIKRYFFDGDAQICYPERQTQYPQSLTRPIQSIQQRSAGHRG